MYISSSFAENDPGVLAEFVRQHSFGTLITSGPGSGLCASHIPFLLRDHGPHGTLVAHVARQNNQWRALRADTEVLVIFQGPHAYVSPRWYKVKPSVPTWNYTAVHAYGRPRLIEDPTDVLQFLAEMVQTHEGSAAGAWRIDDVPPEFIRSMVAQIVVFAIDVQRIEGKFKLSQVRSAADQQAVVDALEIDSNPDARGVAALMHARLDASGYPSREAKP
jgi:transcriptional regulator